MQHSEHAVPSVTFVPQDEATLQALASGDLAAARAATATPLNPYFVGADTRWLWQMRLDQVRADPPSLPWIARVALDARTGTPVGIGGFHGPPDASGMVEVGYSVDPEQRRRGYARAILRALLERAAGESSVRTVRASIRPDNAASLATIAPFGFTQVGEQWDEVDGLELIFEVPAGR